MDDTIRCRCSYDGGGCPNPKVRGNSRCQNCGHGIHDHADAKLLGREPIDSPEFREDDRIDAAFMREQRGEYPTQRNVDAAELRYARTGLTIDAERAVALRRNRQNHAMFATKIDELITLSLNTGGMKARLDERAKRGRSVDRSQHDSFMSQIAELRESLILADAAARR